MPPDNDRIQKPVRRLRKFLKKAPSRPDSQQIHKLRTDIRRVETTIQAFALGDKKNERRVLRSLARLRKRAGKIRDMDVLTGYALRIRLDGELDCLVQLLEGLGAERNRHARKLKTIVKSDGRSLRKRLARTSSKIDKLLQQQDTSASPQTTEAAAKSLGLASALGRPSRLHKRNLHDYRLRVKELRYLLQLSDRSDQQKLVAILGSLKDAIGEWHDWEELLAFATAIGTHGPACRLLAKQKATCEKKYDRALSFATRVKNTYFAPDTRTKTRKHGRRKRGSLARPVLAAASTIIA
ncbi:MAG TPA: CHAD domain-containing protein [Candidatus Acidoferrum sp.]|jgi:CHAD domain-containing protein